MGKITMSYFLKFLEKEYGDRSGAVHRRLGSPFKVLISCILSQRTTEENTEKASKKLFRIADTPRKILKLTDNRLQSLIKSAGFYRQKTKKIKQVCNILLKDYRGKVPKTREELMKLPGVGYKTSAVTMSYCFNSPIIPVDTHVFEVSKRLGFAPINSDVEEVRRSLEKLVPKNKRYKTHLEIIHFGREVCRKAHPKCKTCPILKKCPRIGLPSL